MTVTVNHAKTNAISDWTQAQLDEQIALGNFPPGTTLANIVLPSDWNNDHTLTGLGTMAEQDATAVAITGGTINNTTIGATTATTGKFTSVTTPSVTATTNNLTLSAISTGVVNLNTLNGTGLRLSELTGGAVNTGLGIYSGTSSQNTVYATPYGTFANSNMYLASKGSGNLFLGTNSNNSSVATTQTLISHTASAVNYVQVTGSSTGNQAVISVQGSDTNVPLAIAAKGTGTINLQQTTSIGRSATNWLAINGSTASGNAVQANIFGADTNVSLALQPKGTGAINLAAGSSGVNISNGGTVTAITRTAAGNNYTSPPTIAISAPTTAGGVQATATCQLGLVNVTITNGGTGYAVGNVLTVTGGTFSIQQTFTVSAVSSGVITAVSANGASYSVLPSNPVSVTGGAGSGATFTITWGLAANSTFTITNAGSGYIEQPTITFSGGGGSGAAAYARVGSNTQITGLGAQLNLATESGIAFRVLTAGATATDMWQAISNGTTSILRSSNATANSQVQTGGTGALQFGTNSGVTQLQVAHTASAVNYVQVTGSATGTGNSPTISAQGSDADVNLTLNTKANGLIRLQTAGITRFTIDNTGSTTKLGMSSSGGAGFQITATGSQVNSLSTTGTVSGSNNVVLSTQGTDTNIDLSLTPKGTGLVRFGTYTAGALTATGYINIKAADGTTYKVLVST